MNDSQKSQLYDKIRKLLTLSNDAGATPGEAAAASAKVRELLLKYDLDMTEIPLDQREGAEIIEVNEDLLTVGKKQPWEITLSSLIAQNFMTTVLLSYDHVIFIGRKIDVEIVAFTFSQLRNKLADAAYRATGEFTENFKVEHGYSPRYTSGSTHPKVWRNSWIMGAVKGIRDQLAESKKRDSAKCSAMIVVRGAEVNEYLGKVHPNLASSFHRSVGQYNSRARNAGYEFGHSLSINPGLGGDKCSAALTS